MNRPNHDTIKAIQQLSPMFYSYFVDVNYAVLAAWFRLNYPHITIGALASSAPLLYFDNITLENAYFDVVTRDFRVNHNIFFFIFYGII